MTPKFVLFLFGMIGLCEVPALECTGYSKECDQVFTVFMIKKSSCLELTVIRIRLAGLI